MQQLEKAILMERVVELEELRNSRVLILAASHFDMEMLPSLYEQCQQIGRTERLDVVIHGRGGIVNAARRIALLLRSYADHLTFIVPFHCESSATLLTLCGDEIIAGELALFSPIDPQLTGNDGAMFSAIDIQRFGEMAKQWFALSGEQAQQETLRLLCESVLPPSLTAFYRTTLEMEQVANELLTFQLPNLNVATRQKITHQLISGYHSHNYALTGTELASFGLNVSRDMNTEKLAWEISKLLQACIGGGNRNSVDEPWVDALLATQSTILYRYKQANGMSPRWTSQNSNL